MCYPTTFPSWAFVREKLNAEEEELRERGEIEGHVCVGRSVGGRVKRSE